MNPFKRLFARRSTEEDWSSLLPVTFTPIGVVRNGRTDPPEDGWADVKSRILIRPEYEDALLGLDTWSHLTVVFFPHLIPADVIGSKHRLHPRDDPANPLQGVLATRSQIRFNPTLITAVRLRGVKGNVIHVTGLDALDGTPVIDVKPYMPRFDSVPDARMPSWVTDPWTPPADKR